MAVIADDVDRLAATITVHAQLHSYPNRVWELLADPRALERWWGPLGVPASLVEHDLTEGGRVVAVRAGPEGADGGGDSRAAWDVLAVDPPHRLEVREGAGRVLVRLQPVQAGVAMTVATTYADEAALDEALEHGAKERLREALSRLDALL